MHNITSGYNAFVHRATFYIEDKYNNGLCQPVLCIMTIVLAYAALW